MTALEQVKNLLKNNLAGNRDLIILLNRVGEFKTATAFAAAINKIDPSLGQKAINLVDKAKKIAITKNCGFSNFVMDNDLDK